MKMKQKQKQKQKQHLHLNLNELPPPSWRSSAVLSGSHLSRAELLKRRMEKLRLLSKCYRELYWALLDRLKAHFRHYLWHFGLTPFTFSHHHFQFLEGSGDNDDNNTLPPFEVSVSNQIRTCSFLACKLKAMPLTSFCHLHILSDSRQMLYQPCSFVIKSAQAGPITCGKPILRSTVPTLCIVHFQKAQKHLTRTLKRAGLNVSSTNKTAPKFHLILTEYVGQIQAKRRRVNKSKIVVHIENDS